MPQQSAGFGLPDSDLSVSMPRHDPITGGRPRGRPHRAHGGSFISPVLISKSSTFGTPELASAAAINLPSGENAMSVTKKPIRRPLVPIRNSPCGGKDGSATAPSVTRVSSCPAVMEIAPARGHTAIGPQARMAMTTRCSDLFRNRFIDMFTQNLCVIGNAR